MSLIARQASAAYRAAMVRPLLRLMTLIAVLLMPLGVASAPAAAAGGAAAAPASAAGGHCDEHQEPAGQEAPQLHCAACAALPALDGRVTDILQTRAPLLFMGMPSVSGTEPEIATPPPKLG